MPHIMHMCESGAYKKTTSGGLSPRGKVESLSSRAWGFMLDPALMRVKIPRNPGMMGSGAVATTPAMVFLVRLTCARVDADRKVVVPHAWVGAGVTSLWDEAEGD